MCSFFCFASCSLTSQLKPVWEKRQHKIKSELFKIGPMKNKSRDQIINWGARNDLRVHSDSPNVQTLQLNASKFDRVKHKQYMPCTTTCTVRVQQKTRIVPEFLTIQDDPLHHPKHRSHHTPCNAHKSIYTQTNTHTHTHTYIHTYTYTYTYTKHTHKHTRRRVGMRL